MEHLLVLSVIRGYCGGRKPSLMECGVWMQTRIPLHVPGRRSGDWFMLMRIVGCLSLADGVNCMNGNETEQAADARVPLQSKSHQQIPPTQTFCDLLAPWRWWRSRHCCMPPASSFVTPEDHYNARKVCCPGQWLYGTAEQEMKQKRRQNSIWSPKEEQEVLIIHYSASCVLIHVIKHPLHVCQRWLSPYKEFTLPIWIDN